MGVIGLNKSGDNGEMNHMHTYTIIALGVY